MDSKTLLDSLQIARNGVHQAEAQLKEAKFKLDAVLSQLQENLRASGNVGGVTSHTMHPCEQLEVHSTRVAAREPLDLSAIPQSPASRVPHEQLPSLRVPNSLVLTQAPAAAPAAAFGQPTPERSGPTPERQPTADLTAKKAEQMGHFMGLGSVWARFLSAEVISSGKGMIKPNAPASLQQYSEDALRTSPMTLISWPSGFYRDSQSSARQLLVHTGRGMVLLANLEQAHQREPLVALLPLQADVEWLPMSSIELMDILMFKEMVEGEFKKLTERL